MAKRPGNRSGNTGSSPTAGPVRPWTDEEMAAAKPFPLPTVDPDQAKKRTVAGVPHAGNGETTPGGHPEGQKKPSN